MASAPQATCVRWATADSSWANAAAARNSMARIVLIVTFSCFSVRSGLPAEILSGGITANLNSDRRDGSITKSPSELPAQRPSRCQYFRHFLNDRDCGRSRSYGQQRQSFSENKLQPCSGCLRCQDCHQDQGRVKSRADDAGLEGHAGQHDSRPATGVGCNCQVDYIQATEARQPRAQRHCSQFDNTSPYQEANQHTHRKTGAKDQAITNQGKINGDKEGE